MANTYTLISGTTVGSGGTANIEFTSIPSTYTDLLVKMSLRNSRATGFEECFITFNSNVGNIYTEISIRGNGSTVVSTNTTDTRFAKTLQNADTSTASTFSNWEFYIPNYTSSNHKSVSFDGVTETNATTAYQYLNAGLFASGSSISSIKIDANPYLLMQYSTAYLYGIKNS